MSLPAAIIPWLERAYVLNDGVTPNSGGFIYVYEAGTSTPLDVFGDSDLNPASALTNPLELDSTGRAPKAYIQPTGAKYVVCDSTQDPLLPPSAIVYTFDNVSDPGWTFFGTFGEQQSAGAKDETDGYTVTNDDALVTMKDNVATDAAVNLQPAADRLGLPLIIKNLGTSTVSVQPNGSETIDGVAAAYVLAAFATPDAPTITLVPTTGGYFIASSHAL